MLCMETFAKIRRRHHVHGESISHIARSLNLSRNTVKKYLHQVQEPSYERRDSAKPKLGASEALLQAFLEHDAKRPKRERRNAKRLFEDLQQQGYLGAYDSVQRFVKAWRQAHHSPSNSQAFIPLTFAPGEAAQFDWSHEQVSLGGMVQTIKLAHFRLCDSRHCFLVAYARESQEMVLDAHNRAFSFFAGVPNRMIYDNPKTLVDTVLVGKERRFNPRFLALANHYLFEPVACTPAAGWEKGQVENQVGNIRQWLFTPRPSFETFEQLNAWLLAQCQRLAQRPHPEHKAETIIQRFEKERPELRAITQPFSAYTEHWCRVSSTCTVGYDRNRYSVPSEYARKLVALRASAEQITLVNEGQIVAEHPRSFARDQQILNPWHYLPLLERKPGALRNGRPFQNWPLPPAIEQVKTHLLRQTKGDRAFVDILLAIQQHGSELVTIACELALEHRCVSAAIVLNHIHRLSAPISLDSHVTVPKELQLEREPEANCQRYDQLRVGGG